MNYAKSGLFILSAVCAVVVRGLAAEASKPGGGLDKVESLVRKPLDLAPAHQYPVRVTFRGAQATAQVGGVNVTASQAILGQPKTAMNRLVFGERAVFQNVTVARSAAPQL